jgi:probable HAF family extracellular repeat protein
MTNSAGWYRAFRWTEAGGMEDLGTLPGGTSSEAFGVSADGSIVVGSSDAGGVYRAFRWTEAGGMEDLNVAYANLLDDGSYLETAQAISPDGRYIVGTGYNAATGRREAYLLDTRPSRRDGDVNGDGCVDDSDLLRVLFAFGATGNNLPEDLTRDGTVDDADLLQVLFNFGSGC